ncbi:CX domain-containing protein [Aphelenchoides besseyi]|nr:CX domain-containing protein [Aphelenchoides besseyi]
MCLNLLATLCLLVFAVHSSAKGGFGGGGRGFSAARSSSVGRSGGGFGRSGFSARAGSFRSFNARPVFNSGMGRGSYANTQSFKSSFVGTGSTGYVYRGNTPVIMPIPFYYGGHSYIFASSAYHNGRPAAEDESQCRLPVNKLINLPTVDNSEIAWNLTVDEPTNSTSELIRATRDASKTLSNSTTTTTISPAVTDDLFAKFEFENGTRPTELIWTCGEDEICCGTTCCPSNDDNSFLWVFGIILVICLGIVCCIGAAKSEENTQRAATYTTSTVSYNYNTRPASSGARQSSFTIPKQSPIPMPSIPEKSPTAAQTISINKRALQSPLLN